jgi:hypothetical protein
MLRVTADVLELRRWAEARGGRPCRDAESGRLRVAFGDDGCAIEVGWAEFEPAFRAGRCVLVYDDAPGTRRHFVGPADEAQAYVAADARCGAQA